MKSIPTSNALATHASARSRSTAPPYVSQEPRAISETSRSLEPSRRRCMDATLAASVSPVPQLDAAGSGGLVEEQVELAPGVRVSILRPPSPEELIDERAFADEEFLPYWAELWPSGVALARFVAGLELEGTRVLELGCGLGLPSLAAALRGADVLASDWAA